MDPLDWLTARFEIRPRQGTLNKPSVLYLKSTTMLCVTSVEKWEFCRTELEGDGWKATGNVYQSYVFGSSNLNEIQQCFEPRFIV